MAALCNARASEKCCLMIYLLHFDRPFKHAKHYIGFCKEGGLDKRMARHRAGQGARLIEVILQAGIGFALARVWKDADRNFERKLKHRKEDRKSTRLNSSHANI